MTEQARCIFDPTKQLDLSNVTGLNVYDQLQNIIVNKGNAIHYALFPNRNVIEALINGEKQIESRLSKYRIDPFGKD